MEPLEALDDDCDNKRTKDSPEATKEDDSSLLRLPVEVHRRILSFLNYYHQLSLLVCSSSLRKTVCKAMTRAGALQTVTYSSLSSLGSSRPTGDSRA